MNGLAEKRPSILYNDYVYAWVTGTDVEYEGWVYRVQRSHILLVFAEEFYEQFSTGTKLNFRFTFNRMHLRVMHRALGQPPPPSKAGRGPVLGYVHHNMARVAPSPPKAVAVQSQVVLG